MSFPLNAYVFFTNKNCFQESVDEDDPEDEDTNEEENDETDNKTENDEVG